MTNAQMKEQIEATAAAARSGGQCVDINTRLPYVSIDTGIDDYFFQEHAFRTRSEAEHWLETRHPAVPVGAL